MSYSKELTEKITNFFGRAQQRIVENAVENSKQVSRGDYYRQINESVHESWDLSGALLAIDNVFNDWTEDELASVIDAVEVKHLLSNDVFSDILRPNSKYVPEDDNDQGGNLDVAQVQGIVEAMFVGAPHVNATTQRVGDKIVITVTSTGGLTSQEIRDLVDTLIEVDPGLTKNYNGTTLTLGLSGVSFTQAEKDKLAAIPADAAPQLTIPEIISGFNDELGSTEWQQYPTTDEIIDSVSGALTSGLQQNITVSYDSVLKVFNFSVPVSGGGGGLTAEEVQDIVGAMLGSSDGSISFTYNDVAGTLDCVLADERYTTAEKNKLAGIQSGAQVNDDAATIKTKYESNPDTNEFSDAEKSKLAGVESGATADQTDVEIRALLDALEGNTLWRTQRTDEEIQDIAAAMITSGIHSGITPTYDDANNRLNLVVSATASGDVTIVDSSTPVGLDNIFGYSSMAVARTGNEVVNTVDAVAGGNFIIKHNDSSVPTFTAAGFTVITFGSYAVNQDNYIYGFSAESILVLFVSNNAPTGEINTASNLGGGAGFFAGKSGVDLQFKSLTVTGAPVSSTATEVNVDLSGISGTANAEVFNAATTPVTLTNAVGKFSSLSNVAGAISVDMTDAVVGGWAQFSINAATKPTTATITNGTLEIIEEGASGWVDNTDLICTIRLVEAGKATITFRTFATIISGAAPAFAALLDDATTTATASSGVTIQSTNITILFYFRSANVLNDGIFLTSTGTEYFRFWKESADQTVRVRLGSTSYISNFIGRNFSIADSNWHAFAWVIPSTTTTNGDTSSYLDNTSGNSGTFASGGTYDHTSVNLASVFPRLQGDVDLTDSAIAKFAIIPFALSTSEIDEYFALGASGDWNTLSAPLKAKFQDAAGWFVPCDGDMDSAPGSIGTTVGGTWAFES